MQTHRAFACVFAHEREARVQVHGYCTAGTGSIAGHPVLPSTYPHPGPVLFPRLAVQLLDLFSLRVSACNIQTLLDVCQWITSTGIKICCLHDSHSPMLPYTTILIQQRRELNHSLGFRVSNCEKCGLYEVSYTYLYCVAKQVVGVQDCPEGLDYGTYCIYISKY